MITGKFLSTEDGGTEWFASPAWVKYAGVKQQVTDMAGRGEWYELTVADPPTYREWKESGGELLGHDPAIIATNPEATDNINVAAEYVKGSEQELHDETRRRLEAEVVSQIPQYTAVEVIIDPDKERDTARFSGASSDKLVELENTADVDLDAFSATLEVADPQAAVAYSRFNVSIVELEPWVGAPANDLGLYAILYVQEGQEAQGAEARLHVVSGPETGAVLPFTQSVTDPRLWTVESRDGFKWSDPEQAVDVRLLWGAGSLQVSPTLRSERKYDRKAVGVRYGIAA